MIFAVYILTALFLYKIFSKGHAMVHHAGWPQISDFSGKYGYFFTLSV